MKRLFSMLPTVLGPIFAVAIEVSVSNSAPAQPPSGDRSSRSTSSEDSSRRDAYRGRNSGDSSRDRDSRHGHSRGDGDRGGDSGSGSNSTQSPSSSSSSRPATSTAGGTSMSVKDYARKLIKENDKDGDGMLKGDELRYLRGPAASADLNHDGVITLDELVTHLSAGKATRANPSPASGTATTTGGNGLTASQETPDRRDIDRERDHGGHLGSDDRQHAASTSATAKRIYVGTAANNSESKDDKSKDKRRTWRFTRPAEHLPPNLPSWFKERDRNGDGQVSMSEYSRTWSKRTAEEFQRYDIDGDGIITPQEAVAVKK